MTRRRLTAAEEEPVEAILEEIDRRIAYLQGDRRPIPLDHRRRITELRSLRDWVTDGGLAAAQEVTIQDAP